MSTLTLEDALALLKESFAERDAAYKAEQDERDAKYKAEQEAYQKRFDAALERIDRVQQLTGSMQLDLGKVIELVLMPKLCSEVNKYGHKFLTSSPNKRFYKENGNIMLEMDLLLENCDEVMVIEIKSDCKKKDIDWHLGRLKLLRQHENTTGMKGKTMYAAIATISIEDDIRDLALNSGMYVITIRDEEDRVDVIQPATKGQW